MEQAVGRTGAGALGAAAMRRQKVLVASNHGLVRHGIKLMLGAATSHLVVDDEGPLRDIGRMLGTHDPDIVVADVSTGGDGLDRLLEAFGDAGVRARLLVLCDSSARPCGSIAAALPDATFVTAIDGPTGLLDALREIAMPAAPEPAGWRPAAPAPQDAAAAAAAAAAVHVTPREREVIELITQGLCSKRIARALNISVTTVRTHRQRLMTKLGLRNSVEVAQFAARTFGGGRIAQAGDAPRGERAETGK